MQRRQALETLHARVEGIDLQLSVVETELRRTSQRVQQDLNTLLEQRRQVSNTIEKLEAAANQASWDEAHQHAHEAVEELRRSVAARAR